MKYYQMGILNLAFILLAVLGVAGLIKAQNPIVPPGMYIADPEAHVWEDGRLYIYGSRDESDDYYCSHSYHVLSTRDLKNWKIVENSFATRGEFDQVSTHDKLLYAPDCAYKDGTYYLYYCSPGEQFTEGVATSTSPNGPFVNGRQIEGPRQIDPAVLVDDDGQAYFYWGQQNVKAARLKTNMAELDSSTIVTPLDEAGHKAFHEGASIRKIGEWYYMVFADESRRGRPTSLGYAVSKDPLGPFEYKGIIIDNYGSDPSVWNNHGSIEKFNSQWYVFYHRSTHNSKKFRKACVEPITINADGTIGEVEMTTQGALEPLPASDILDASRACKLSGQAYIGTLESRDLKNEGLVNISNNDHAVFRYLNFDEDLTAFRVKTRQSKGGTIEVRLDSPTGTLIGRCAVKPQAKNTAYQMSSCDIQATRGDHAVYLVFKGEGEKLFNVDWFQFY